MKNLAFWFCCIAMSATCVSCQKELAENDVPVFWALTDIVITDGTTHAVKGRYKFEYDSTTRRATKLSYTGATSASSKVIYPTYSKDTVYLGISSFLVLDASKRVRQLAEFNARPGITNGDYYYAYNGEGQLHERQFDDSFNDAVRTTFNYNDGDMVQYAQDFKGFPLANTASLTYLASPRILGFGQYSLLEIFPELLLYMPTLSIGRTVLYPLQKINSKVSVPAPPEPPSTTTYSNFVMNARGNVESFDTQLQVGSNAPKHTHYDFTYRAYN